MIEKMTIHDERKQQHPADVAEKLTGAEHAEPFGKKVLLLGRRFDKTIARGGIIVTKDPCEEQKGDQDGGGCHHVMRQKVIAGVFGITEGHGHCAEDRTRGV